MTQSEIARLNFSFGRGDAQRANGDVPAARAAWQQALAILDEVHDPGADEVRGKLRELDP